MVGELISSCEEKHNTKFWQVIRGECRLEVVTEPVSRVHCCREYGPGAKISRDLGSKSGYDYDQSKASLSNTVDSFYDVLFRITFIFKRGGVFIYSLTLQLG